MRPESLVALASISLLGCHPQEAGTPSVSKLEKRIAALESKLKKIESSPVRFVSPAVDAIKYEPDAVGIWYNRCPVNSVAVTLSYDPKLDARHSAKRLPEDIPYRLQCVKIENVPSRASTSSSTTQSR